MPTYLHPGVYVEEISGGAKPIEAVGTSTAAFIGIAEKGPLNAAVFITNFTEFQQNYGGYLSDGDIGKSYLAYSVYQFFLNGGSSCYVVRVEDGAATAGVKLYNQDNLLTLKVTALSPGVWGNDLRVAIGPATISSERFNLYVFLGDELVEAYENLSMIDQDLFFVDRVAKKSLYIRTTSSPLPDNPTFAGKKDLSGGVNLTGVKNIKLQIDNYGPYIIDCSAGAVNVAAVTADEIRNNINKAFAGDIKVPVASVAGNRIQVASPADNDSSQIVFTPPGNQDATCDIFGLEEWSWKVDGSEETIAQAPGSTAPDTTAARSLTMALGTAADATSTIALGASLFNTVSKINQDFIKNLAYTDGAHLVLNWNEDIRIRRGTAEQRTHVAALFGSFYSYVSVGSGSDPATIAGDAAIPGAGVAGNLKIKIDATPAFVVSFNGESTAQAVSDTINNAYQKITKSKKKIAQPNGSNVTLTSIDTGPSGRIIISTPPAPDAAAIVLGTKYINTNDFLIPAEKQFVARLSNTDNIKDAATMANLAAALNAAAKLRMSADGPPAQFPIVIAPAATAETLFTTVFSAQPALNYKLLALVTPATVNVCMMAVDATEKPQLQFSIPLSAGEGSPQAADPTALISAAYMKLFGNQDPFTQGAFKNPHYTYAFGLPDNNPMQTVIVNGEDLDFSRSISLGGGDQDRTNANRLADLMLGQSGDPNKPSGTSLLDNLTDFSILSIPGWSLMTDPIANRLINDGIAYCDRMRPAQARPLRDIFYVTNTPAGVTSPTAARDFVRGQISTTSAGGYVSIYYPWITVNDPIGTDSTTISIPPAGAIAGLYASIDSRRGVWKAPAGTEAGVAGVISLADQVNDIKQDLLNPHGVNVIRRIPGAGIVAWGARTLATNPEWKYIPVRRTAILIEVSIYEGIQWAVFEPNDEPLWSSLRLNINAFMMNLFRNGAFQGSTPEDAFFVKCDSETTTQADIDLGKVNIHIGFAPLKPAEFVIVKISQKAGQTE
jgi:phage tail sheath protein FI